MSDFIVGLTGGIGSGKSAAAKRFQHHGIASINADQTARDVVAPGEPALSSIAEHFGQTILLPSGELDRSTLRKIVFNDPSEKSWLESLLHPLIRQRITRFLRSASSPYALLETPLLVETNQRELVDKIVVVDVPESIQIARTMARDNNDEQLVRAIIAAQANRQDRLKAAHFVLDNSGDLTQLYQQVDRLHQQLLTLITAP